MKRQYVLRHLRLSKLPDKKHSRHFQLQKLSRLRFGFVLSSTFNSQLQKLTRLRFGFVLSSTFNFQLQKLTRLRFGFA